MAESRGRGRAFLFKKPSANEDIKDSASVASNDPPKPRGRAAFLQTLRYPTQSEADTQTTPRGRAAFLQTLRYPTQSEADTQTTISGSNESGADLSSGGDTSSLTVSSTDPPRPRGRAGLFSSKSSSSGAFSAETATALSSDIQNLNVVDPVKPAFLRGSPDKERSSPVVKHGISGHEVDIAANYVRLELMDPEKGIWEYEVIFGSEVDNKYYKSKLVNMHFLALGGQVRVYDMGALLYTPMETKTEVTSGYYELENGDTVKVTFKRKRQNKLSACRNILNIIIKQIMYKLELIRFGSSAFNPEARTPIPQHKLEIWPGCITVVGEYEGGVLLNCDVSHRVLQNGTVYDLIKGYGKADKERIMKSILGLSVITRYNNRHVRIDDVDWNQTPLNTFDKKDGSKITYVEYYEKQYGLVIQDKKQPLLISKLDRKPREKANEDVLNYYVPELCHLTVLTDEQRNDPRLMKDVTAIMRLTPTQRDQALSKFLQGIHDNPKCKKLLEDWGLKLPVQPIDLKARTLAPETIYLGNKRTVTEPNADWGRAFANNSVLSPIHLDDWAIIYTARDTQLAESFFRKAKELSSKMGIKIAKPKSFLVDSDDARSYCAKLRVFEKVQIVVIIFPSQRDDRYAAVKKLCNVDLGLPSQVIISRTLRRDARSLNSIVSKIMLQITCKVGGSLWGVTFPYKEEGVMFCGIDVYHEGAQRSSSIIALVCSINKSGTRWTSATARHARGQEISDKIIVLFRDCLMQWYAVTGTYPQRIIMFRDGVGDGQLRTVRDFEIPQFYKIFQQVSPEYSPAFTYIIVQKRIKTRYYVKQCGRLDNPPPGTVLDHTVTKRDWYDFFLVSQNVRQGTVAPTHYIVIEDQSDMSPDTVQKLTYKMTYLYYNWTGTVRVPAPCQYAHKLAYLVGQHVHDQAHAKLRNTLYFL